MMLELERCSGTDRKVAALAAEPPDDRTRPPVDLVHGRCVPGRDEQIAVGGHRDRVEVKVVEDVSSGRVADERLVQPDVVAAAPVEQDASGNDVDLLDDSLD